MSILTHLQNQRYLILNYQKTSKTCVSTVYTKYKLLLQCIYLVKMELTE